MTLYKDSDKREHDSLRLNHMPVEDLKLTMEFQNAVARKSTSLMLCSSWAGDLASMCYSWPRNTGERINTGTNGGDARAKIPGQPMTREKVRFQTNKIGARRKWRGPRAQLMTQSALLVFICACIQRIRCIPLRNN